MGCYFEQNGAAILGSGAYLPERIVENDALESAYGLEPGFIASKTGIVERRISGQHESAGSMAAEAATAAVRDAAVIRIDHVIVARDIYVTQHSPSIALPVIRALEAEHVDVETCGAMDIANYCLGFANALSVARLMVRAHEAETVLVVASADYADLISTDSELHRQFRESGRLPETAVRYSLPPTEYFQAPRYNMCLWGCGAGAVVVGRSDSNTRSIGPLSVRVSRTVGHDVFGFADLADGTTVASLDGRSIASFARTELPGFLGEFLAEEGCRLSDIDAVVPHQPNVRLLHELAGLIGIPDERFIITCDVLGNLGCASIPVAYHLARRSGRLGPDQRVLFCPFGDTQLTMGAMLLHT